MQSEHVTDLLGDYYGERLGQIRQSAVEAHLSSCPECRREYKFAGELSTAALRQGHRHISTDRLVAASEHGTDVWTGVEAEHFAQCRECRQEMDVLAGMPGLDEVEAKEGGARLRPSPMTESDRGRSFFQRLFRPRAVGGSIGGLVAASIVLVLLLPNSPPDVTGLARVEPIDVRVPRSVPESEFDRVWMEGLGAYVVGDFQNGTAAFSRATEIDPGHAESWLLLGSSYLLDGKPAVAVVPLEKARGLAGAGPTWDEATWQLANARLVDNRGEVAEPLLRELGDSDGARSSDARAILDAWP